MAENVGSILPIEIEVRPGVVGMPTHIPRGSLRQQTRHLAAGSWQWRRRRRKRGNNLHARLSHLGNGQKLLRQMTSAATLVEASSRRRIEAAAAGPAMQGRGILNEDVALY